MTEKAHSARTRETRDALLEQLSHLRDEVTALRRQVKVIPNAVLQGRPLPSDPSFNELYALLAWFDEQVYTPAVTALVAEGDVVIGAPPSHDVLLDGGWSDMDVIDILDRVAAARGTLVDALAGIAYESWTTSVILEGRSTDVFGLAYAIVQHDAATLRAAAMRLHESRLTTRDDDLPK